MDTDENDAIKWVPIAFWEDGVLRSHQHKFEWLVGVKFPPVGKARKKVLRVVSVVVKPYLFFTRRIQANRDVSCDQNVDQVMERREKKLWRFECSGPPSSNLSFLLTAFMIPPMNFT